MKSLLFLSLLLISNIGLQGKPNIILIFTDDLGYGDLGVLFQNGRTPTDPAKKLSTPFLDSMAAEGTILNRHYCAAPVCAPARGTLLSGQHQGHANVRNRQFDKAISDNHTLASTLKEAGYYTAAIGKYGLQGSGSTPANWPAYPTKRGFDYFMGYVTHVAGHQHYPAHVWPLGNSANHRAKQDLYENNTEISADLDKCYTTDLFTARAKKIIVDETTNNPTQPFFIYLAYDTPHAALQLPTIAYPAGKGTSGGLQWNGTPGNMINTATGTFDSYINPLYSGKGWPNADERFATMITRIDHCVGDLIQTLKDLNIDDNTLVIFTSDNGPHEESYISGVTYRPTAFASYGPFEGIKQDVWEGGIRVPTLAWGPTRVQAGATTNTPSQAHDWMPTFCDYASIPTPARADGVSLRPTLSGTGTQKPNTVYIEFNTTTPGRTPTYAGFTNHTNQLRSQSQVIYMDGYKGVRANISSHANNFLIYDTINDLRESNDLAGTSAYFTTLQQRMKDQVLRIRQTDSAAPRPYDNELVTPLTPSTENGLVVKTYEGTWSWVPEFEDLTALASNNVNDFSVSHLSRNNDAGLYYSGFINIPTDGTWTFYNTSDSGTSFRIHDSLVLDDDFNHSGSETSGTMKLKAGLHPIRLYYRSGAAAPSLDIMWAGPGTAKATIPTASLFREIPPPPEPVANPDSASTPGTNLVSIAVLANDTDDDAPSPLSIQSVGSPSFGNAVINGSNIDYTASAGQYGVDQFTYTITDGQFTASTTVTVTVTVPSSDLWFPLNETSGTSVAEAGGLVPGLHDSSPSHIVGKHGYALHFDGIDDQIVLSGITLPIGGSSRTIAAWIRTPDAAPAELQVILGYGQNSNGQRFSFRLDGSTTQRLRLEVAGGFIVGTTKLNDGNWHHVACVVDSASPNVNQTQLYVDGILETISSSGSRVINTSASGSILIGGSPHANNYNFGGDIDELRIYSTAKTGAEIAAIAAATDQPSAAWVYGFFGNSTPAWTSDTDSDGSSLLDEYAFGGSPHTADSATLSPKAVYNSVTNKLEVTFARRKLGSHDLTYTVEVSDDLSTWTLPSTELSAIPHPVLGSDFDEVKVETGTLTNPNKKRFVRIKVL